MGVNLTTDNVSMIKENDSGICILAVKPNMLHSVVNECGVEKLQRMRIIISILAGTTIDTIQNAVCYTYIRLDDELLSCLQLGGVELSPLIVRVMPNTPALVSCAASVFAMSSDENVEYVILQSYS
jgi:pyrroline-5-carboxylate reductase